MIRSTILVTSKRSTPSRSKNLFAVFRVSNVTRQWKVTFQLILPIGEGYDGLSKGLAITPGRTQCGTQPGKKRKGELKSKLVQIHHVRAIN